MALHPEPAPTPAINLASSTTTAASSSTTPAPTSIDDDDDSPKGFPPMTTHWSPPKSCTWTYDLDHLPQPGASGIVAWLDQEPVSDASSLSCYPDGMFYGKHTGVFSPGTCPGGWTTARMQTEHNVNEDVITTVAVCCSSEYSLHGDKCLRSVSTVLAVPITYNQTANTYDVFTNSTTTLYSATIAVYTIRAMFEDGDKKLLGLTGGDEIGSHDGPDKLTLSTKVGIGVGVAIFALLAIGLGLFFFLGRHNLSYREKGRSTTQGGGTTRGDGSDSEVSYGVGGMPLRLRRRSNDEAPPPAWKASTQRSSSVGDESAEPPSRDAEIRALKAQQAAIQRRIEELEHTETEDSPDESPDRRRESHDSAG